MPDSRQPLLPPGTGPTLMRGVADFAAALLWFVLAMLSGGGETDLFGNGGTAKGIFSLLALIGALTLAITFGLRMASIALERIPNWVSHVELWTWIALPLWFILAVTAVRL